MKFFSKKNLLSMLVLVAVSSTGFAQLPQPNAAGVTMGHTHLNVPDLVMHREIWKMLGGKVADGSALLSFPGMYVVLTEAIPTYASTDTSANHFGFSIQDYDLYKAKLAAVDAEIFYENAEAGQILADLPGGVRIELQKVDGLDQPIVFHHLHLSVLEPEEVRAWYVKVFGAEEGERRGSPSALVPGGRVDFMPARGDAPLATRGEAIDHIGFDVADMDVFAERMEALGVPFDVEPVHVDALNVTIAFITDPAGTFIEITEGLVDVGVPE